MHAPGSSVDITKQSFWAQRLQTADTSATTAVLFDKASPIEKVSSIDNTMPPPAPFARTTPSTGINPSELRVAAIMHYLSPDTLILAAWAILCRSYAGEDGPVSFGACLDREGAAWLFAMPVSGDDRLLGAMRAAEQDKKLVLDHALAFDSLAAFSQSTGYVDLATAVYICSGAPKTPDMHLPSPASLIVNVGEGTSIQAHLHYRRDAMTPDRAQSIVDNFNHVLGSLTERLQSSSALQVDELRIRDVDAVSRGDYRRIVEFSSAAALPARVDACVHDLVLSRCRAPGAERRTAVDAWDGSFTYAEMAVHVSRLAGAIVGAAGLHGSRRRRGGSSSSQESAQMFVPFCLTKSRWTPVAILAIMAAGGACVPLEPSHPPARRNEILAQTKARVVLTNTTLYEQGLAESFLGGSTMVRHVICVDAADEKISNLPKALPAVRPSDLCYIIFTSGSSGTPKGVKWAHAALATSTLEQGRAFCVDVKSRVLQFASHVFDVSVAELVTPLVHGGCIVVPADKDRTDPGSMAAFMKRMGVTAATMVPSFARLLLKHHVPSLKTVILGGEPIGQDNIDGWTPRLDRLIIGYGSAETCINCARNEFSVRTRARKPWVESLGTGAGSRMLIADRDNADRLVPIGGVGEILVEGPILAEGYLHDPAKTARAFIENPAWTAKAGHFRNANGVSSSSRRRFYRTGDLGRQAMDGSITFMGRADFQVKVRGQRMELGEVRSHMVDCLPQAVDIHVDVICPASSSDGENVGDKSLAAFLSFGHSADHVEMSQPDASLAEALRSMLARLREVLPPAAIPTFFIPLAGFPYLVSGKVDRRRLLAFANQSTVEELSACNASFMGSAFPGGGVAAAVDPETELEEVLVDCCSSVLRLPSLGVGSNFFASGGDSLSAIKVVDAAREKGVHIAVADIFNTASIRELAQQATMTSDQPSLHSIDDDDSVEPFSLLDPDQVRAVMSDLQKQGVPCHTISDLYPCTPLQEALIALSSTRQGAYVSQHILDLPRHVDIPAFKASWQAMLQRHDILRTRIFEGPQGAVQAVCDAQMEWSTAPTLSAYCAMDKSLPMGFGDGLVRFGLVGKTFVLTIHHSAFDGWSITRLFEDVERHYAGQQPLHATQFKHFIRYQSVLDKEAPKKFWESALACEAGLASCHFPQMPNAAQSPIPDAAIKLTLPTSQYATSDFTIPTRIRAAWALLVGRHIDSQDVIFGETLSGRMSTMPGVQEVSGPTISTVPFRVKWSPEDSVSALLRDIQSRVMDMTNAGHIGVQNISRLSPAAHEACQFQHIIVIQPRKSSLRACDTQGARRRARIGLEDATLDLRNFHNYALNMDFTLEEDAVTVTTTFDSRVFSPRDIEHLQAQFQHVLDQVCRDAQGTSAITNIDYASPLDTQLQIDTNRVVSEAHEPTTLLRLLGRHVAENPAAPAIAAWDGSMTYEELDRSSSALANHLGSSGLRRGDCVPYCFPKSLWATVAILATLKIGATAVALEPSHPDASIAKVLAQVRPRMALCSRDLSSRIRTLTHGSSSVFAVDAQSTRECVRSEDKTPKRKYMYTVQPEDTAFIVFTSGSTGEPKGIPLDHGAVCIMARQHGQAMNIDRHSRILQFAAYVFDVSIGDLAIALFHGSCLCVPSDADRMDSLACSVSRLGANRAWLTPSVASLISPAECPTLEWLSVGGEQLTQTCKDIWAGVPLVNVYGPAEVANIGTAVRVSPELALTNIGRANGVGIWVCGLGDTQRLAPVGCVGEIVFEGRNVSRGYLDNKELTAKAFPTVPSWSSNSPVRMYRTGDLGRLNADGSIEFMGRRDTQIKLRGQRIEVTAVETALKAAIDEPVEIAVDMLHGSDDGDASLVAFVHLPSRQAVSGSDMFSTSVDIRSLAIDVRSRVKATLPAHMIPSLFLPLSRLPKLVSGKIDRKTLRLAAGKLTDDQISAFKLYPDASATAKKQPRTPAEAAMQSMWASVLRLPESDIGVDDDFVSLGGDSITAIKLVARARAQDVQLSVASVFQHATIANICGTADVPLAMSIEENTPAALSPKKSGEWAAVALECGVSESQIEDVYPCTALQEGMLMLTEKKPTAYIAHHVMPLPDWVDVSVFRRAWEAVVHTHAILRTRITLQGQQVVFQPGAVDWTVPASDDLLAYIQQTGEAPMGFGKCLSHQTILNNPRRFVWATHHSLYDGWSMPLLADAINKAYTRLSGTEVSLPKQLEECPLSFRDFVDHISNIDKNHMETFWRDQLEGADPASFPPGMPSSYEPLADSMVERAIPFPRDPRSKTTTSAMIRTAWAMLISAYSGSHADIVFGSAVTGRSVPLDGLLDLIGPTLATVPVRIVLNPKQPLRSLLAKVQQQSFAMLDYEQYGLQNIRQTNAAACDFQSLLVVHAEGSHQEDPGNQTGFSWSENRDAEANFLTSAVTLECQPLGERLALSASYDSSVVDEKQMQRMLATFEHILGQVCRGETTLIVEDIDMISPQDRAEMASITNHLPAPTHERVHDMFARQTASSPEAMAISASDGDMTYRQLDRLSTKLSRHLRSLGVGAECFVPFCFEKSKYVPVALLAILKAGGACVPLDPAQPLDRLRHIIGTLDARVVLTSATHSRLLEGVPGVQHLVPVSDDALNTLAIAAAGLGKPGARRMEPSPSSACYAIFTSGSTGTPKGVVWEHATLCSSMAEHGAAFNYSPSSRVLQFSSHTFDVSVSELLTTLVHGGCVCIPDDFTRMNDIAGFIAERDVNWAFFAPSFARLMDPDTVPSLRTVVLGGEAPGRDNIERWSGRPGLELIVTYGPAESCIYCAKNSVGEASRMVDGSIGHSIGGIMWIADLGRPERLAPIGAVGEIAVEGSILARGYLKDAAKTAASFRHMPGDWAGGRSERVYYTGDLGRVNSDGTISCLGRRDDQVKIRGQRVELADIEYHLRKDDEVRQALVLYPRTGSCADHLTGVLSMSPRDGSAKAAPSAEIVMAAPDEWTSVATVQERLEAKVPSYMVPSVWIVLESIPLMPASQKVNRKMVSEWTRQMDQATYAEITRLSSEQTPGSASPLTDKLEEKIRDLWCTVLNISQDTVGPKTSFLRIGGDSISAMQIISRCRNEGLHVAVQDLLKAKTFADFCDRVRAVKGSGDGDVIEMEDDDDDTTPFALSPIQSWFMALAPYGENHFNQSHLLRFTEHITLDALEGTLLTIIQRHPMLRARFEFTPSGTWQQSTSMTAQDALQCRSFQSVTMKKAAAYAFNAQASLDIINGPLLAADMYAMTDGTLALFITCHHLVVDLVSWRIILQEMEEILRTGRAATDRKPLSFRTWCRLVEEHAASSPVSAFDNAPSADWAFWGISSADNVVANVTEQSFALDQDSTQLLLGGANDAFNTEPLDLLLTGIVHSFNQVFRGFRSPIAVFNESHGREPWRPEIDLSSTVGWFTSMSPVTLSDHGGDVLRSLQEVKDLRRRSPDKGISSFSRFAKQAEDAVEATFNYFGLFQQFEKEGSLLNQLSWDTTIATPPSDASPDVPRFSLFDISAGVEGGTLKVNFAFSDRINHQGLVRQWVDACSTTLTELVRTASENQGDDAAQTLSLSDFPHLPATYDELAVMLTTTLPNAGVDVAKVQDIYPCSSMQTALLMSQAVDKSLYAVRYVWEVIPKTTGPASLDRMMEAWRQVVQRHPMLRTVFVQGLSSGDGKPAAVYHQVVLKELEPSIEVCNDAFSFPLGQPQDHLQGGAPHHVVLCQDYSGKLLVQLDISHALVDGTSINMLVDSTIKAYDGIVLPRGGHDNCYANFVSYLRDQDVDESLAFWKTYLAGSEPCHFPSLRTQMKSDLDGITNESQAARSLEYLDFHFPDSSRLHASCTASGTTTASVFKLAWALVLQSYTGINAPCFGFLASGRDLPIDGIDDFVGPFINMLICQVSLEEDDAAVEAVLSKAHADYANCLAYQVCSLAEILRALQIPGGGRLFNTVMSVQRLLPPGTETSEVDFKPVHVEDPSEFDIVLNIGDSADLVDVSLTYNTAILSKVQAEHLGAVFNRAIDSVLDSLDKKLKNIDLLIPQDYDQMVAWNSTVDTTMVEALCDDLIDTHLASRGSRPAISGWDLSLTYTELDSLSTALADHLVSRHAVGRNILVPFCFEKSSWAIVVMLAIIKAGAAFVPLDPKHPVDRLAQIVQRVGAPLVITSEKKADLAPSLAASLPHLVVGPSTMPSITKDSPVRGRFPPGSTSTSTVRSEAFRRARHPTDLAYCLFTSGSTGTPKGVLIQHQTMSTSTTAHGRAFGYSSPDMLRTVQFSSYAFDACIAEIFTTLIMGGCVCVPSDEHKMDPRQLMGFMERERTNMVFMTPAVLALLDERRLPFVEHLLVGGEAVPRQLVEGWMTPRRRVLVVYGPTECCVYCSGYDCSDRGGLPLGRNMIGTTVGSVSWIGTSHDPNRLAPIGAVGELLIEGPILARGYLDDEEKTAASFVKPAWMGGDRTVYRTGDLVRYIEDGSLEYLGRRDNQVKLRGQRLELGEIEQQLMTLPDVQQCVVLLPKEGRCRQKITALLRLTSEAADSSVAGVVPITAGGSEGLQILGGDTITSKLVAISQALGGKLPSYMVPSCWMATDRIHLLPSGKSDRRFITGCIANIDKRMYRFSVDMKLDDAVDGDTENPGSSTNIPEPAMTPVAQTLRKVWSSVLNLPEQTINPESGSFIRLGGDSISAMEVVAQSRAQGVPLLIENLLKATSINSLASVVEESNPSVSTSVVAVTHGVSNEEEDEDDEIVLFGLSPIQRMFAKLAPRENHFNQSFLVKVNAKSLSEDDVRRALDVVVKRHAMLRARFQRIGRNFRQWIEHEIEGSYTFRSWDVSPSSSPFPAEAVPLIEGTQKLLDLEGGPVFAGDLFTAGTEQFLFLTAHHLVVDLVSWRIILKDLEDYLVQGSISSYRSLSFEKWCGLLTSHRKALLQAPNPTHLPFDVPRPDYDFWGMKQKPNYAADFEHHQFTLPADVSQTLLGDANDAFGTEALDLFIAAVMHSFASTFPDRAIPPVYNEGHGREPWDESHDLSKTVGWFTTIAPIWFKASNKGDIVHFVKQVKDVRRKTPAKGFSHFTALDLDRKPFEIELSFNYFGAFQQLGRSDALLQQVHWESIGVDPCEVSADHKKFSLIDIAAESSNDQLIFTFSFNRKLRHQQGLRTWMDTCRDSLQTMARSLISRRGEIAVSDFEHLPDTYNLDVLRSTTLRELGVHESNVEDIYPCSPAQQGMLLSQSRDPDMYWFRSVYEVQSKSGPPMTASRLRQAWKAVVQRHPALRTVFIEQNSTDGLYDQLVLRSHDPSVDEMDLVATDNDDKLLAKLKIDAVAPELQASRKPQHQLRIARQATSPSGSRVFFSLLISHAIVDGGSMGVILRDLDLACQGRLVDTEPVLFKNYITYLKSRDHEADLGYWKQSLDGVEPCILPVDPTAANSPRVMDRANLMTQDTHAYTKMASVARELGVSAFTLLQVTWALTLRELTDPDRDDCCFGVVTSGRDLPVEGIRDMAGPLVNILASRVEIAHDVALSRIAETVHDRFVDNLAHQTSSLAEVTHELGSGTLFNTGMTMQKIVSGSLDSRESGVAFNPMGGEDPTEFDIVIHAIDDGSKLHVHMNYWRDKVSPGRAEEIARIFSTIQGQMLQRPGMTPADLDIVSAKDVAQLWSWNARLPQAVEMRIEDMIAQRVVEMPTREALWSTTEALSYHQLDLFSTKLAETHLADLGREEIVPLCFDKSIWVVVAMVAVLKAGGTVVLMDPSHPADRLRSIVTTTKAKRILASPSQANMCSKTLGIRTTAISKTTINARAAPSAATALPRLRPRASSSDAAYIVFTSGSTGTPKGSVTEHRSFCTAVRGYHTAIGQLPGSRVLQFASHSFDASILETLGSLMVGATVCVPSDRERADSVSDFIRRARVSFAVVTPTTAELLRPDQVPSLTGLALCGEPMTASHIATWGDRVRLVNAFGPSECCVGSAANPRVSALSNPRCIGWAVSCCYWVVHPRNHDRLARVGSVGELLIEGPILARHYLGEEAKTREAFITAPAWARPGRATRLYKTGDLVCQNPDGSFQYVGRKDCQAKIRGQRLELGDVEQALRDVIPQCTSVVAEVIQNEGQVARLVVFFSGLADIDVADVQSKIAQRVPAYMVPSSIVPLPQLPLMPSGKVDRKKMRAMAASLPTTLGERSGRAPESPMEVSLAAIWKKVVKTSEKILAADSFFHIGGDSFTAMKLVTEARSQGITLSVSVVMRAPKLEDMARQATQSASMENNTTSESLVSQATEAFSMVQWTPALKAEVSRQCRISESDIEDVYPCTPLQEGLFVLSVKQPGSYMARHCFRLSPELDIARYKEAWNTIFESSLILRTHLVQLTNAGGLAGRKSGLYQAVIRKPLSWKHETTALDKYVATPPLPALGAALVGFAMVEDKGARYLVLTMHHAAYDGTSLDMLLKRVEAEYTGGPAPPVTPFREAIKHLDSIKGDPTKRFWTQYLAGARASKFPVVPEGYVPSAGMDLEHTFPLPTPKVEGFTVSTLIRVAWSMVMAHHAESDDIVVAETLSGRNDDRQGIAEADGPLITTVPARCILDPSANLVNVLEATQRAMVDMIPFQQAGLQNIRFMSADAAEACSFSCLVSIAPESVARAKSAMGVTPVDGPPAPPIDYALSIQFVLCEDRKLKMGVSYDERLVDGAQMRSMMEEFGLVLGQLCSGEKKQVRDIEVDNVKRPDPLRILNQGNVAKMESQTLVNDEVASNDNVIGGSESSIPLEHDAPSTQESSSAGSGFVTTRSLSEIQQEMRALWAEILEIDGEDVGDEDNFFRLGGDSISAMRLVTTAEQRNISIIVADVFHHPTFTDLCEFAAQAHTALVVAPGAGVAAATPGQANAVIAAPPPPVPQDYRPYAVLDYLELDQDLAVEAVCSQLNVFPGDVEDVFPATDYQAWAVSHGLMRSRGNTNYFLFRLHGNLDTFLLEQACRRMVASNPILRTLFTTIGSQVMQVVLRSYQIEFQRYGREHSADDSFIRWLVEQDTHREAFLSQSIVRFKLLRHTLGHYVLVMRVSHAQYDGMSLPLLCQDLQKAYGGAEPLVRPSFGKFIQGGMVREEAAIDFWSQLLEGSSVTEIVEHPGPAFRHNVDTIRSRTIPPIPVNVAGMTQATLVKAAWALVLAKMSGQRDIVFGNLIFGRNMPVSGIDEISGPCINMVPIRVRINEMDNIQDLLALVQEQQLAAMPHENLGFRHLVKHCTDWPTWTRFSSVVQHQKVGRNVGQDFYLGDDVKCEMGVLGPAYDSSDLWVQTTPSDDSFKVEIGSCSAVVSPKIAETLLDRLCTVLTIFGAVGSGNDHQLWELLARDHAPLIPVQSPIIDQVWSRVLPDGAAIPWDAPYYDYWGDEIAPVRFLEEYADHGIHLDMEDILGHPTKQEQMMLTAGVMAEQNGTSSSSKRDSRRFSQMYQPKTSVSTSVTSPGGAARHQHQHQHQHAANATTASSSRSFWMLDGPGKPAAASSVHSSDSKGGRSRGGVPSSARMNSPKRGPAFGPQRSKPQRKGASTSSRNTSRSGSVWDVSSSVSLSGHSSSSNVSVSSPSLPSSSRPRLGRKASAAVDW